MKTCLLCNRTLQQALTIQELFSFQPYRLPAICSSCFSKFSRINKEKSCAGCSRSQENIELCEDCQKWLKLYPSDFIQNRSLYQYDEKLKEWLHQYKFRGDVRFASVFRTEIERIYQKKKDYLFVPLPVSEKSMQERGFNQSELILQTAGIPYQNVLTNHSTSEKQSGKNRRERMLSDQPFHLINPEGIKNKKIMLFDDVYTTGRTMLHAKALIAAADVSKIESFSIGR